MTSLSNSIYPEWPSYSDEKVESVKQILLSGKVNHWTVSSTLEFADFSNYRYAVAVANGTVALDLGLKAFDVVPRDEVIVTPRSYIASVSSVILVSQPMLAAVLRFTKSALFKTLTTRQNKTCQLQGNWEKPV